MTSDAPRSDLGHVLYALLIWSNAGRTGHGQNLSRNPAARTCESFSDRGEAVKARRELIAARVAGASWQFDHILVVW